MDLWSVFYFLKCMYFNVRSFGRRFVRQMYAVIFAVILFLLHCIIARKPYNAAAVLFGLKFADNSHYIVYKFKRSLES